MSTQTATPEAAAPEQRRSYQATLAILLLSTLAYALQQTLIAPALPAIQTDLGVSTTAVTYVLTAFLLSASVCTPILGRLGDMFGKKKMLVLTLALFGLGSLIAAVSHSIEMLIAGRVVQGAGGAIFPLAFGIVRDEFPRHKVAGAIGLLSAMFGIGGAAGVVLSGVIVDNFSYEWCFWLGLTFTAITMAATWRYVPESPITSRSRIDWGGAALMSAGLVALLIATSEGNSWGWLDNRTIWLYAAAGWLLIAWIAYEQRHPVPLVDVAMLRKRPVFTTNLAAVLIGFGMYSSFILFPKFVQTPSEAGYGFGSSVTQAGLFLLPNAAAMLIAGPATGAVTARIGSRRTLMFGTVLVLLSFLSLAFLHDAAWQICLSSFVSGIGIGFAFSAMPNLIIEAVDPSQTGIATGMNAIMRTIGGAIGGQVAAAILTGYATAAGFPEEFGYTLTFLVLAAALAIAVISVLAIPETHQMAARGSSQVSIVTVTPDPETVIMDSVELTTPQAPADAVFTELPEPPAPMPFVPPTPQPPAERLLLLGHVRHRGVGVAEAILTVLGPDGREVTHTTADRTGAFAVPLPLGHYHLVASWDGLDPVVIPVEIDGQPRILELDLAGLPDEGTPSTDGLVWVSTPAS